MQAATCRRKDVSRTYVSSLQCKHLTAYLYYEVVGPYFLVNRIQFVLYPEWGTRY